jgi:RNA polymerase sigma-70 factor (ECF subfamily)
VLLCKIYTFTEILTLIILIEHTLGKQAQIALSDNEIIREYLRTHKQEFFSILYRKYADKVYRKCYTLLKDQGLAEDAMQDIFVKIMMNLASFNEKSQFSTWIYSITYNYCIDYIRKHKKEKKLFVDDIERAPDLVDDVPDEFLLSMEVKRLKVILDRLPVDDNAILLMKYQDDMSIKEIAELLGKTESAVKMKIKRAKEKAQEIYHNLFKDFD